MQSNSRAPWWLTLLLIIMLTPLLFFLGVSEAAPDGTPLKMLLWFYPTFCVADAVCAWLCYPQRKEVTWILIGIMALSHLGIYILWTENL